VPVRRTGIIEAMTERMQSFDKRIHNFPGKS
jgi:hypothetical protein